MNTYDDTIAAISTPLGDGGIGIVKISGKDALEIAERIFISTKDKTLLSLPSYNMAYGYIVEQEPEVRSQRSEVRDQSTEDRKDDNEKIGRWEVNSFKTSELQNFHIVDEVLISVMRAPYSYTKEDVVEINCHGGFFPIRKVLEIVLNEGARLAVPGEFTFRAFLNGRIDLIQAEAVIDLIRSKTEESSRIANEQLSGKLSIEISAIQDMITEICANIEAYIDFPEEEIEPDTHEEILNKIIAISNKMQQLSETYENGRFFRDGMSIAIVGRPNVGKSSLLNAILETDRAIVTDIPGTTIDMIEEYINLEGIPARIMDTAGIREVHNLAEKEGVKRSLRAIEGADIILSVFDCTMPLSSEDIDVITKTRERKTIFIINKSDLPPSISEKDLNQYIMKDKLSTICNQVVNVSAKTKSGLDELKDSIINLLLGGQGYTFDKNNRQEHAKLSRSETHAKYQDMPSSVIMTNLRHKNVIDKANEAMKRAQILLKKKEPLEIVAIELRDALSKIGEIIGNVTTDDILNRIFSNFCIGK